MLLKTSTIAACSCSCPGFPARIPSRTSITSSCAYNPKYPAASQPATASRKYATIRETGKKRPSSREDAPPTIQQWPSHPNPTPYDIFSCGRDTTYSKTRFYELVKIYHPDRHQHVATHTLTPSKHLERYRLIIAANEILSDPDKRRAYDLYGVGCGTHLDSSLRDAYRDIDRNWRKRPGNPSMNATWEDWERWYGEQAARAGEPVKPKQTPVYMSNELFVAVLCAFVVLGSMGQARRANKHSMNLVEMQDAKHEAITGGMARRRTEQAGLTRDERVDTFLRSRQWSVQEQATPNVQGEAGK